MSIDWARRVDTWQSKLIGGKLFCAVNRSLFYEWNIALVFEADLLVVGHGPVKSEDGVAWAYLTRSSSQSWWPNSISISLGNFRAYLVQTSDCKSLNI